MSDARDERAKAKLAAYFRTPEGQRSEAEVAASVRRENAKMAQQKVRKKMVQAWRMKGGGA